MKVDACDLIEDSKVKCVVGKYICIECLSFRGFSFRDQIVGLRYSFQNRWNSALMVCILRITALAKWNLNKDICRLSFLQGQRFLSRLT